MEIIQASVEGTQIPARTMMMIRRKIAHIQVITVLMIRPRRTLT